MCRASLLVLGCLVIAVTGCETTRHATCTSWRTDSPLESYCVRYNRMGCAVTGLRRVKRKWCTNWQCDPGYVKPGEHADRCALPAELEREKAEKAAKADEAARERGIKDQGRCDRGDAEACLSVRRHQEAAVLLQPRCAEGNLKACSHLEDALAGNARLAEDGGRAAAAMERLCQEGCSSGHRTKLRLCTSVGSMYRAGHSTGRDLARARALFTQGCDRDLSASCSALGEMSAVGEGAAADPGAALGYYMRACENAWHKGSACTERDRFQKDSDVLIGLYPALFSGALNVENYKSDGVDDEVAYRRGMKREAVDAVVRSKLGELASCRSGSRGIVRVRWSVSRGGRVEVNEYSPRVTFSTLGDPAAEKCVLGKVVGWVFPPHQTMMVHVSYTFALE